MTKRRRLSSDPSSLGNLARIYGMLSACQLRQAIEWQTKHPHRKLGEGLVEMGLMTREQVDFCLQKQTNVRDEKAPTRRDVKAYVKFAIQQLKEAPKLGELYNAAKKKPQD